MKIVVSLTTIPSRENSVLKTIESLKNNTVKPDIIYVNLREYLVRLNQKFSDNFESKLIHIGARVNKSKDYGSLTKIIPMIEAEKDPETIIITADDDIIYNERYIEGLLKGFIEFEEKCVVGYSGIAYPDAATKILGKPGYICFQNHGDYTHILESGFGTILKRKWLDRLPIIPEETKDCEKHLYTCDDYYMSLYYDYIGICKRIVKYPWIGRTRDDWSSFCTFIEESSNNQDSLSNKSSSIQNYYNAMKTIKDFLNKNMVV